MKNKKQDKGFSLISVLIAAGMTGLIAVALVEIASQQGQIQKRAQISFGINSISGAITQMLFNIKACTNSLGGTGTPISESTPVTIKAPNGDSLYAVGNKFDNGTITIQNIAIVDLITDIANRDAFFYIEVTFLQSSQQLTNLTIPRKFPVQAHLDAAGNLEVCYSAEGEAVLTARKMACNDIGGTWTMDASGIDGSCTLVTDITAPPTTNNAVSTQYLLDYITDVISDLEDLFVNVSGDNMTGVLTNTHDFRTDTQFCVQGRCRDFTRKECPVGQVARTTNEDGSVVCANVTCPDPTTFYVGVDAANNPVCKPFPTNTCGVKEYVAEVRTDGSVVCLPLPPDAPKVCAAGTAIQAIHPDGTFTCTPTTPTNQFCPDHQYLAGFDAAGLKICKNFPSNNFSCPADHYVSGIQWNGIPTCSPDKNVYNRSCPWGQAVSGFGWDGSPSCATPSAKIRYDACFWIGWGGTGVRNCPWGYVMTGTYSNGSDSYEWNGFTCCLLE